jgi:glycosyltransferase involved in cell wall biosynthesis
MPKVLILCAHRPGRSPSQRYRFEQYLPWLESRGYTFTWSYLLPPAADRVFYAHGRLLQKVFVLAASTIKRMRDQLRFSRYDVIFIQREACFFGISYFEKHAYRSGAYVIFDFDDSIWLADTSPANLRWEWVKRPEKFFGNVRYAHTVIAGNKFLAEKARVLNSDTVVIPTTIDTSLHVPKPELRGHEALVIGWSGSITTVKHFEILLPVLTSLKTRYGSRIRFKLHGVSRYSSPLPDLSIVPWNAETETDEINSFDIGVMPLPAGEWSLGKCALKALSYMACEVPAVISAIGVNNEIISHGTNGFLATTAEEWFNCLSLLIENAGLRKEIGRKGRETVEERYSVNANREKYLEVFERHKSGFKNNIET